tara:strand:+ start:52 stop:681 length:630 start_codon:yes stop_codon:yes gene_type:complete
MKDDTAICTPVFSKPIYSKLLNIDTKRIVSIIEEYEFHRASSSNGGSSSNSRYILEDEKFKFLKDELIREFYVFASGVMRYSNEFEITTSWATKIVKGQGSDYHNHNNCMISGILYLQTDETSGDISFRDYDTKRYQIHTKESNIFNSTKYRFTPSDRMLLLFPSEVQHKVEENNSDIIRYSLAFNVTPVGLIGNDKSDSHLTIKIEKS